MMESKQPPSRPLRAHELASSDVPRVNARELMGPHREIVITHGERDYRLRITQNGKLILTA